MESVPPLPFMRFWLLFLGFLHFNQYDQVIQAALAGHGIALGRLELIQSLLGERRLVPIALLKHATHSTHAHWLIRAEERPREDVRRVAEWIEAEARSAQGSTA